MRKQLAALCVLLSLGASAKDGEQRFEISNVKVGLACVKTTLEPGQDGWVCQPTKDIYVVDQGSCVYDKREVPCTWHGLEFDYKGAKPGARLVCNVTSSQPSVLGNPKSAAKSGAKQLTYELRLDKSEGHHFEAQYMVFELREVSSADVADHTQCSLDGHVVLSYDQVFHFPVKSH